MTYYLTCLPNEFWWGGAVAQGMEMPLSAASDYELNGTINRTDNQYNALFVSSRGRYLFAEHGCILRFEAGGQITLSEVRGEVDLSEGHGTLKGAYRAAVRGREGLHGLEALSYLRLNASRPGHQVEKMEGGIAEQDRCRDAVAEHPEGSVDGL